jgi:hypothetical protein
VEHKTGEPVSVQTADGSYTLTVGTPLGSAVIGSGSAIEVGVPIKIDKVAGSPKISATYFVLGPVSETLDGSGWEPGSDGSDAVCRGVPSLSTALYKADPLGQGPYEFTLAPGVKASGCIGFIYGRTDKPTTVGLHPDGGSFDSTYPALTWQVQMPRKAAPPPPSGTTYAVTSDGGISSVTYSTAGFNTAQDTAVPGNTWTKTLPDAGIQVPSVIAQAGGGATSISCSITVDGETVIKQTSHGAYAVVTCTKSN